MSEDAARLLTSCYRALLNRDPDGQALATWTTGNRPVLDLDLLLDTILRSAEFSSKRVDFCQRYFTDEAVRFVNDHSQFGEIELLMKRMINESAARRVVVDVGANGRSGSNSYDLLRHLGWRGVLVEANPRRVAVIEEEFANLDVVVVNRAVSDYAGQATFHLGVNEDVSSLSSDAAAAWGPLRGEITVEVERLPDILRRHDVPRDFDLLTVDAEGEDIRILNDTIGSDYAPRWVIIEASKDYEVETLDQIPTSERVRESYKVVDRTPANLILQRIG